MTYTPVVYHENGGWGWWLVCNGTLAAYGSADLYPTAKDAQEAGEAEWRRVVGKQAAKEVSCPTPA